MNTPLVNQAPMSQPGALMPGGSQLGNPLDQLADIHLPEPVSSFPWAIGWWAILILAIIAIAALTWYARARYQSLAWRRAALAELDTLKNIDDEREFATALNQLLRRIAVLKQGAASAGLNSEQWRDFLAYADDAAFNVEDAQHLIDNCYAAHCRPLNRVLMLQQCRRWILSQSKRQPGTASATVIGGEASRV